MSMQDNEFENLINNYVENEDVIITNARGFWEKAPVMKSLIINTGHHILLKKDTLETLKNNLINSNDEDKFYMIQEFCAEINMPNAELIKSIINFK